MPTAERRPAVLIADDDEAVRQLITAILDRVGCFVVTAANGEEAVDLLHIFQFDVLIVDVVMPGQDGIEVIEHVRRRLPRQHPGPRIIAISGAGSAGLQRARQAGAHGTIDKPFTRDELLAPVLDPAA